jgi:hypothetical protein
MDGRVLGLFSDIPFVLFGGVEEPQSGLLPFYPRFKPETLL